MDAWVEIAARLDFWVRFKLLVDQMLELATLCNPRVLSHMYTRPVNPRVLSHMYTRPVNPHAFGVRLAHSEVGHIGKFTKIALD
jgi:hypothetical protein